MALATSPMKRPEISILLTPVSAGTDSSHLSKKDKYVDKKKEKDVNVVDSCHDEAVPSCPDLKHYQVNSVYWKDAFPKKRDWHGV